MACAETASFSLAPEPQARLHYDRQLGHLYLADGHSLQSTVSRDPNLTFFGLTDLAINGVAQSNVPRLESQLVKR